MNTKVMSVTLLAAEVFVVHKDDCPFQVVETEVWVPTVPTEPVEYPEEDGTHKVENLILAMTPVKYSRLMAGRAFGEPVRIALKDWGEGEMEVCVRPNGYRDIVTRRFAFVGGDPLPCPSLDALAKEMKELDSFYNSVHESCAD